MNIAIYRPKHTTTTYQQVYVPISDYLDKSHIIKIFKLLKKEKLGKLFPDWFHNAQRERAQITQRVQPACIYVDE